MDNAADEHTSRTNVSVVRELRAMAAARASALGHDDLSDDTALVMSELAANAVLHGGGFRGAVVSAIASGVRVEVRDGTRVPPVLGQPSDESLTGRGLRLVARIADRWGATLEPDGKVVWAEVTGRHHTVPVGVTERDLLAMWADWAPDAGETRVQVDLGDVPSELLLAAKLHVDNVVRELTLAAAGAEAGLTAEVPAHLADLLAAVVDRFSEARLAIKHKALEAARLGAPRTHLSLDLPVTAADAAEEYLAALDEVDAYCRAQRLLTLETPPQHRVFRQWYVGELVAQLRAAAAGEPLPEPQPFESRLLAELDRVAIAQRASDRAARLYAVTVALATATTPEAVAAAVLNEGVAALGASGGGMLLATGNDTLALPGTVGYDERVVARLRNESRDAELPAAVALRTGRTVWIETREDRDREFPALVGLEASTVAMCAVPLVVDGRRLGALRFSFVERRLFDDDERRFVLALAAQTAQALDRAQLHHARLDVSRRLQRSLLPPTLPDIPGLDVAALYHPFGDGIDVGGDFYDVWTAGPDRWAIAIGDAAGTGPEAAVMTAFVRHTLRVLTMSAWDPEDVLRTLNTALLASVPEADAERFCTALLGIVTPYGDGVAVRLAGGGHPPALVRRTGGTVETAWVGGSLLGLFASADVDAIRVVLHPGDTLVLVTDGVLEARREGDMFDAAGLEHAVSSSDPGAAATVAAIQDAVLRHTGGVLTDDMAAVVVHVPMR